MTSQTPPSGPWTILVADDEPDMLSVFQDLLEAALPGVRVVACPDGPRSLEVLRRERIDLVLTDYRMPGMSGVQLLTEVRKLWPHLPRIMITAYADPALEQRVLAEGIAHVFLSKGVEVQPIIEAVRALLRNPPSAAP